MFESIPVLLVHKCDFNGYDLGAGDLPTHANKCREPIVRSIPPRPAASTSSLRSRPYATARSIIRAGIRASTVPVVSRRARREGRILFAVPGADGSAGVADGALLTRSLVCVIV